MNIETFLLKHGIRTYSYPIITEINAKIEVAFGDSISTELGWIYGISAEVEGVTPKDGTVALPTMAQAAGLYINLQYGKTWFLEDFRYTNMVFYNPTTVAPQNERKYYPINIPYSTDLKQSIIRNPLTLSGFSAMITFHYIPKATYAELVDKKIIHNLDKGIR